MSQRNIEKIKNIEYWTILLRVFYKMEVMGDDPVQVFEEIAKEKNLKKDLKEELRELIIKIKNSINSIDKMIEESVFNWNKERILKIDLVLLRIGIGAFLFTQRDARKIITEILDISKIYSTSDSYRFLNGILDKVAKKLGKI